MANTLNIKKFALSSLYSMLVFGILTILLGYISGSYRGFYLSLTLGLIILITSVVYIPLIYRRRDDDMKGVATPALKHYGLQHQWL
jgi:membrane protein DedA with SNARE-associated domain